VATLGTTQITPVTGVVQTLAAAAAGGDKFQPGDHTFLVVANGSGGSITVTIDSQVVSNFGVDTDGGGPVAGGATRLFGPFPSGRWAAASDGLVAVTYSAVTSLTVGVFSA
jgi:hypothetical protein